MKNPYLIEQLAELEHKQWQYWCEAVNPKHPLLKVPYSELSEDQKEKDRIWARKVWKLIKHAITDEEEPNDWKVIVDTILKEFGRNIKLKERVQELKDLAGL